MPRVFRDKTVAIAKLVIDNCDYLPINYDYWILAERSSQHSWDLAEDKATTTNDHAVMSNYVILLRNGMTTKTKMRIANYNVMSSDVCGIIAQYIVE